MSEPHWQELIRRARRLGLIYLTITLPLIWKSSALYAAFTAPFRALLPEQGTVIAQQILNPITVPLWLAVCLGFWLLLPMVLYETWQFIAPGLYPQERKTVWPWITASTVLGYVGAVCAYQGLCPWVLRLAIASTPPGVAFLVTMRDLLDFILGILWIFGISAQIPLLILASVRLGWITLAALEAKRAHAIVLAFTLGMILTPPDVCAQILVSVPLWALFELGVAAAKTAWFIPKSCG